MSLPCPVVCGWVGWNRRRLASSSSRHSPADYPSSSATVAAPRKRSNMGGPGSSWSRPASPRWRLAPSSCSVTFPPPPRWAERGVVGSVRTGLGRARWTRCADCWGRRSPMAAQTTSSTEIAASPTTVLEVITDLEGYPAWTASVREVDVLCRDEQGRPAQARFVLDAGPIKDSYVLAYSYPPDTVQWTLVEASLITALDGSRSEEHTSELQSRGHLVCRLLLEKKKNTFT